MKKETRMVAHSNYTLDVGDILSNQEVDLIGDMNFDGGLNVQDIILLLNIIID